MRPTLAFSIPPPSPSGFRCSLRRPGLLIGALTAALAVTGHGTPQTPDDRLLNELVAVHPYSASGSMTSTANGDFLYVGEGGAIAAIFANPDDPLSDYQTPLWRDQLGSLGVLPVKMLLDPEAGVHPGSDGQDIDILYIAGGRDGLWAMDASVRDDGIPNQAVRIDDSGNETNVDTQFNRKWCNDLAFITLGEGAGEKTYPLALFGKTNSSRLRIYELDMVRQAFDDGRAAGQEFGHEILPDKGLRLGRQLAIGAAGNGYSFAFGMDVDDENDDVYVAMGFHGLGRVHLDLNDSLLLWSLDWGPYFGDDSEYRHQVGELYRDVEVFKEGALVTRYSPIFLDVALDLREPTDRWVYAAVDHLGVVGFTLEDTWDEYIPNPGFHHEGIAQSDAHRDWVQLVTGTPPQDHMTFARRIEVSEPSSALVVTTLNVPFLAHPGLLNMGRSLGWDLGSLGGLPLGVPWVEHGVGHGYTIAYDLTTRSSWVDYTIHAAGIANIGRQIFVHPEQAPNSLSFFVGRHAPSTGLTRTGEMPGTVQDHELHRIEFLNTWPPTTPPASPDRITIREGVNRPGRWTYRASLNKDNPQVLVTGSNDAGLPADGPLVLDLDDAAGARIVTNFDFGPGDPPLGFPGRRDGTHGACYEPLAAVAKNGFEYRFAIRFCPQVGTRWRLCRFEGGDDVTNPSTTDPPLEEKAIFFTMPEDQFKSVGYHYYGGAGYSEDYAAETPGNYIFATGRATPQGVRVLDLDQLITLIDDDLATTHLQNYDLEDPLWNGVVKGEFTTHPEFWNIPECRLGSGGADAENFLYDEGIDDAVVTFPPQFIKLPSQPVGGDADTWVLAVPSGHAACDDTLTFFNSHTTWRPEDPFRKGNGYRKLMVRFFNINTPSLIDKDYEDDETASRNLPAYTLLGPDLESATYFLRTLHLEIEEADDRYFCFVADLGGHMYVFEITDLLTWTPDHGPGFKSYVHYGATRSPTPFETYDSLGSLSTNEPCNVMDIEIDKVHWVDDLHAEHNEIYVYVSLLRAGIQVLRFEPDAAAGQRLVPVALIQTPGEAGFLHLCNSPYDQVMDPHGLVGDRLLFIGDVIAGIGVYTYNFEEFAP